VLNGAELSRGPLNDVYLPRTTFTDRHTVTLGGKRVEMIYLGIAHTPDGAALHFPDERTRGSRGREVLSVRRFDAVDDAGVFVAARSVRAERAYLGGDV
jgi:hypothetical protein